MSTPDYQQELTVLGQRARRAGRQLAQLSATQKNRGLETIADTLVAQQAAILAANEQDMSHGRTKGLSAALLDRLKLTTWNRSNR